MISIPFSTVPRLSFSEARAALQRALDRYPLGTMRPPNADDAVAMTIPGVTRIPERSIIGDPVDHPRPLFCDISNVYRPADRIAYRQEPDDA
jgi:hypothetical protein